MTKEAKQPDQDTFQTIIEAIDSIEVEPDRLLSIQLDTSIREAIRAAKASGQPAGVTVAIKVKPGPERRMAFSANVKAQLPRPPVAIISLYADEAGQVHRSDPAQGRLPFNALQGAHSES